MTGERQAPLPVTSQWPEGRGFIRLYHRNPDLQARLAMTLLGFRDMVVMDNGSNPRTPIVEAVDMVLKQFAADFPEFLEVQVSADDELVHEDYQADSRLISHMNEIINQHE